MNHGVDLNVQYVAAVWNVNLVMLLEDAFDLDARHLDVDPLSVGFQRSDCSRQYNIRHAHALSQFRFVAVALPPMQTTEVAAEVVRLPVCDDVTVGDVASGGEDGGQ